MKKKLAHQRALLEAVIESSQAPIFSVDSDYCYTSFNSAHKDIMRMMYGQDIEVGFNILDYHTNLEDRVYAKQNIERALSGESFSLEAFVGEENQKRNYFLISHNPIKDSNKNVIGAAVYAQDFTPRKMAEEKAIKAKEDWEHTFDAVPDLIAIVDKDHKILRVNQAMGSRIGVNVENCAGKRCYELIHGNKEPPIICPHKLMLEDGQEHTLELHEDKLGGDFINSSSPIYNEKKELTGSVHVLRDITERKQVEEHKQRLLENEQQLTNELQISNEELNLTQNKLRELVNKLETSNKELEQFAYVASHDLQEPLRMVGSFTQLLEMRYKERLDDDADDYIGFIVEGANRMKDLIDDLLAFSRINRKTKEFKLTDLKNALDDVILSLQTYIRENNAIITYDSLPIIKCDSSQIRQLFQNLISNAIKFHSDKPPEIHISAQDTGKEWLFGVSDNSIGIETEHQKKIFDVFQRLHTRDEYQGTGIGLAICRRIVERLGGDIWVESELGKGSTFYFTIPKQK
ncbi:MAG: ATP-binding protein [Methanobacterium sp.]|nr:ATP-binding protein [Methanobacterium sp.]